MENGREAEQASTSGRGQESNHRHSPSWEEKGKVRVPYRLRHCQASVVRACLCSPGLGELQSRRLQCKSAPVAEVLSQCAEPTTCRGSGLRRTSSGTPPRGSEDHAAAAQLACQLRGSSPRSCGPGSSRKGSPSRPSSTGTSPASSPDVKTVAGALGSRSPDAQIRALKRLRLDTELCRCLLDDDRHG